MMRQFDHWISVCPDASQKQRQRKISLLWPGQLLLLLAYFFEGKSEKSAREGILIWCADQLQAVKWRNFKVHFYKQDTMVSPAQKLSIPLLFNLYTNPQEDEDKTPTDTWVNRPGAEDGGRVRSEHKDAPADRHGYA